MKKISANGVTWIDIQTPKEKDLEELKEEFNLHPFIAQQFLPPIHRPKVEEHPNQLFVVLHFPVYNRDKKQIETVELDLIVMPSVLITSHATEMPDLDTFFNDCEIQDYCKKNYFKTNGHLLFNLLDWLVDSCLPMLDHTAEKIEEIESKVFHGKEKEMVSEIAMVRKDLINFRKAIKPQRMILETLSKKSKRLFGVKMSRLTQEVIGSSVRTWSVLENHRELISSIEQTNNSLLSYKLGDIMKFLTVVSFITFPLSVIVGFFGMNVFGTIPLVRNGPYTWIAILVSMFTTTGIMIIYFKKKKWL